jgi:Xaa-Pro aminopeptidase
VSLRKPLETGSHDLPVSAALAAFMLERWAEPSRREPRAVAPPELCARRRARLSALVPDARLVVPAGRPALRGNGQEHPYRPASDYVYLTGERSSEGVLVLEPDGAATLYLRPPSGRDTDEFFRDYHYGELWVGPRPALDELEELLGVRCRPLGELADALDGAADTRVERGVDREVDALVPPGDDDYPDGELKAVLSELRLVKDDWEVAQIEEAVAASVRGYEDVARAIRSARSERELEAAFVRRARLEGNDVAFPPIVAAGAHATILHWRENDGPLRHEEVVLVDAGVESHTLYAADLTRTLPLGGRYGDVQRRMLDLVNDAHEAGLAAIAPGRPFRDFHHAVADAMSAGLDDWGLLDDRSFHRRYTICSPGHMLGLDVHDCLAARADTYLDGVLAEGMVLTVEPGLYFQADDLTLPEELRGIGVRVEDDVVVTSTGCRNLSESLPRRPGDVEAWLESLGAG